MKSLLSVVALAIVALCSAARPKGFVTTKGRNFVLDGKPFAFVGANSYWLPLLTNQRDINATFQEMQDAGIKVLRTWGFNAINATELPFALESNLTYYQVWNGSDWTLNDGPQGLERLDNVIATAGRYDIKVILAFTNNWIGYGGSELYINWIAGSEATHDVFYSHPDINKSYQRYVKTIVNRYKDSSNIFAWELMNEARCRGDLPGSSACDPKSGLISKWYKKQSDFVRNLPVLNILSVSSYITKPIMLARDQHHLITTGGEGQFNWKHPKHYWYNGAWESDYNYNGQAGEDFDKDLNLRNIDFGTYHMYPTFWYSKLDTPGSNFSVEKWGLEWIKDHAKAAQKIGKPLILEEFGHPGLENKTEFYPSWVGKALKSGHSGIMPWQFGMLNLTEYGGNRLIKYADAIIDGASPNDGFTYYKNQTAVWSVFTSAAEAQNRRSWIV